MWLPVGLYFLITLFILHLIQHEVMWYRKVRYKFLKQPRIENFSVGEPHSRCLA